MIELTNCEEMGWEHAIRGMRNPMNSWDKSDSYYIEKEGSCWDGLYNIGTNDFKLMKKLAVAGTDHRKFMRMITVYVDIAAPLYWWKEFDTYKVGTVANSCSTMHKITEKKFTLDDFSHEHLNDDTKNLLRKVIEDLNASRELFITTKDKQFWWQIIQLLPSSYNQKRTIMLNYEVLANIYKSRKSHKLDEWREFCKWIEEKIAYSALITGHFYEEE